MKRFVIASIVVVALIMVGLIFGLSKRTTTQSTTQNTNSASYVALGDSVAAGVGLKNDSDSSACNRTNEAYSHVIAGSRYTLTNVACSGATLNEGINGPQSVNNLAVPSQLDQLFKQPKPEIITLTIGANDVGWTRLLGSCYTGSCGGAGDAAVVRIALGQIQTNLQTTLKQISDHYPQPPAVYVTGYHQVFPKSDPVNCQDLTGIDSAELAFGRSLQSDLNNTLKQTVSEYKFATYAAVDFGGHELCTSDPWVQGLADAQPYHPTKSGQQAYAQAVQTAITKKESN